MAFSGFKPGGTTRDSSDGGGGLGLFWSTKMDDGHKMAAVNDSGYDSLLHYSSAGGGSLSSSVCTSFLASDSSNSSSLFSQPSTPVKQLKNGGGMLFTRHNTTTSPDLKHQYVADINAFYLASLRSPAKTTTLTTTMAASESKFAQAFKSSCNFADFSASNSASPVKLSDSPKIVNPDDFVRERDTITSKLLRSPAFKLQQQQPSSCFSMFSPQRSLAASGGQFEEASGRPFIKSFSSRFFKATTTSSVSKTAESIDMLSPEPSALPSNSSVRTTPTEEEFLELLIKNRHMPNNPEFLIGRRMGIERLDILSELNRRSMKNVIDHILSFATKPDIVRMAGVSREWRECIQQNKQVNGERLRFLKQRKHVFERTKENKGQCTGPAALARSLADRSHWRTLESSYALNQLRQEVSGSLEQKRNVHAAFKVPRDHPDNTHHHGDHFLSPQDRRLGSLDMNCLNNNNNNNDGQSVRLLRSAVVETTSSRATAVAKAQQLHREASLHNLVFQDEAMETDNEMRSPVTTKEPAILSLLKRSPLKAINLLESAQGPSFVTKNLKVVGSPVKSSSSSSFSRHHLDEAGGGIYHGTKPSPKKLDVIGSKKSKKNLKRL